jgi:hypothetical protein
MISLFAFLAVNAAFAASDFDVGGSVACGQDVGVVEKIFSRDSMIVKFHTSYESRRPMKLDSIGAVTARNCVRRLGDNVPTISEIFVGDSLLCGQWEGKLLAAFSKDIGLVSFTFSYESGNREALSETFLLQLSKCERQIAPSAE